jgi:pyruvate dehydrogenase E2 component (dihydrolipoamide acetyltransferase)
MAETTGEGAAMESGRLHLLTMPKWGLAMTEGTLTAWLADPEAEVTEGQPLAEIETAKIANVVESPGAGVFHPLAEVGQVVAVGGVLGIIAPPGTERAVIEAFAAERAAAPAEPAAAAEPESGTVHTPAGPLAYRREGGGAGLPAVLLHGFGGDGENFLFLLEPLAADRPLYVLDLPGHGASSKALARGDLDELALLLEAALEGLGLSRFHLLGHSLGGALALALAERQKARVASLALIAPFGAGSAVPADYLEAFLAASRRREMKTVLGRLLADPEAVSTSMVEGVLKALRVDGAREALGRIAEATLKAPDPRLAALFAAPPAPALVLWGAEDRLLPPPESLPAGMVFERIAAAGHMPHLEAPQKIAPLLARHFAAHDV